MATIPIPQINFNPPVYTCKRADKELATSNVIDGDLSKPFWQHAEKTALFLDIEGDSRPKPRFETYAMMLWDDDFLYIGAELYGTEIWATQTERDSVIFVDNDFEVFIDPDGDTHEYIEFEMNALNTVWDLLLTKPYLNKGTPINAFDIQGLESAVYIDGELNNSNAQNKKWSVEIKMPFAVLNQCAKDNTPAEGVYWRMNFSRVQWKVDLDPSTGRYIKCIDEKTGNPYPEDNWVWSPTGIINIHYPELWGFVFFTNSTNSDTHYEIPQDEKIKWQLRQLYYSQYAYFDEHGVFTDDIQKLNAQIDNLSAFELEATSKTFCISCNNCDNTKKISLFTDGLFQVLKY